MRDSNKLKKAKILEDLKKIKCFETLVDEDWKYGARISGTDIFLIAEIRRGFHMGPIFKRRSVGPTMLSGPDYCVFVWYERPGSKKYGCLREIEFQEVLERLDSKESGEVLFYLDMFARGKVVC